MYAILVTYGTWRNAVYATTAKPADASCLRDAAIRHGYTDARIVNPWSPDNHSRRRTSHAKA